MYNNTEQLPLFYLIFYDNDATIVQEQFVLSEKKKNLNKAFMCVIKTIRITILKKRKKEKQIMPKSFTLTKQKN